MHEEKFNHTLQTQTYNLVKEGYIISAMTTTPDQENVEITTHGRQGYYYAVLGILLDGKKQVSVMANRMPPVTTVEKRQSPIDFPIYSVPSTAPIKMVRMSCSYSVWRPSMNALRSADYFNDQ